MPNEKQLKAMRIFRTVLELILGLFNAHHGKDLGNENENVNEN